MKPADLAAVAPDLRERWSRAGVTIKLATPASGGPLGKSAFDALAQTLFSRQAELPVQSEVGLELGEVIGMGGQAVVRSAEQLALRRSVAVKAARRPGESARASILREAWVAGGLEHPNILPIYTLGADHEGAPLLVMKRIDGVSWASALANPEAIPGLSPRDPLEWHLRVLIQVCQALEYAHARGIVHLDVKPANVMLGAHGAVYLLDWGLAVSIHPDAPDWLPRADEIRRVIGTPGFLSPEQACGDGRDINRSTDIYLLGAVLYLLVNGRPLRSGAPIAAITAAWRGIIPPFAPDVPSELKAICEMALQHAPAGRYATVTHMREALEGFLRHRHASVLAATALTRLPSVLAEPFANARAMHEVRFGLQQALVEWPHHPEAAGALQSLLVAIINAHLDLGEAEAAAAILPELLRPEPETKTRIDALRDAQRQEAEEIASLRRDKDLSINRGSRRRIVFSVGVCWLLSNVIAGALHRSGELVMTHALLASISTATLLIYVWGMWWVRDSLGRIEIERRMLWVFGAGLASALPLWLLCYQLDLTVLEAMSLSTVLYVLFAMAQTAILDRRVWWTVPLLILLSVLAGAWPAYAFEWAALCGLVCGGVPLWVWRT